MNGNLSRCDCHWVQCEAWLLITQTPRLPCPRKHCKIYLSEIKNLVSGESNATRDMTSGPRKRIERFARPPEVTALLFLLNRTTDMTALHPSDLDCLRPCFSKWYGCLGGVFVIGESTTRMSSPRALTHSFSRSWSLNELHGARMFLGRTEAPISHASQLFRAFGYLSQVSKNLTYRHGTGRIHPLCRGHEPHRVAANL